MSQSGAQDRMQAALSAAGMTTQSCVIRDWLPPPVLNGSRQVHWSVLRNRAAEAKTAAWLSAKVAGWQYVPGKVRLTITLVFAVKRKRDTDNTIARCKHLVDGLKREFFEDDDTDHLELVVRTEVIPGARETRILLESV